jgi:3-(3-hydroxy-phenyl)propionate hydroxylase
VARGWRQGRLLIAGDAAHQTPPFMGQGMCAGIRDVVNLAWKLADVVRGDASPDLLASYESERSPHVREFIETAVRLGGIIQATDPEFVRRRDAEMAASPQVFHTPQPALGPGAHDGGALCGRIAAQPVLADGQRFDDTVGYRFALVASPDLCAQVALPSSERVAVVPADDAALTAWLAGFGAAALLLRPDRHVAGTACSAAEARELLRRHVAGVQR